MANDVVFKTKAFGGYDKTEVMDYINNLLEEKAALEKRLSEANARYAQANSQLFEMKRVADENEELKAKLDEALATIDSLNQALEVAQAECAALQNQIKAKQNEIERLEKELKERPDSAELVDEIEALKAEVARLKIEAEKKRDLERQVGAAMLDARIHSEELVEEAKAKASAVTMTVYNAIGETAVKIDELSIGIGEIARSFMKSVEEVELRIKALTGDMSKTAQLLISDSNSTTTDDEPPVEYDFSAPESTEVEFDVVDDDVDDTDSENGEE